MQNDMLKNNIAPWQEKGRWYHITLSSNGTAWSVVTDKTDDLFKNAVVSGTTLVKYTKDFCIIDSKIILKKPALLVFSIYSTASYPRSNDTSVQYILPPSASYDGEVDLYLFCKFF